jgi:hypothetical protein
MPTPKGVSHPIKIAPTIPSGTRRREIGGDFFK